MERFIHRLQQRLVAVAQVDTGPDGRPVDAAVRPLAVRQLNGRGGAVLAVIEGFHG